MEIINFVTRSNRRPRESHRVDISVSYAFKSYFELLISHVPRYVGSISICVRCNSIATDELYRPSVQLCRPQILDNFTRLTSFRVRLQSNVDYDYLFNNAVIGKLYRRNRRIDEIS